MCTPGTFIHSMIAYDMLTKKAGEARTCFSRSGANEQRQPHVQAWSARIAGDTCSKEHVQPSLSCGLMLGHRLTCSCMRPRVDAGRRAWQLPRLQTRTANRRLRDACGLHM
jgi:hypothetical protein